MTTEDKEKAIQELEDGRDGYSDYISSETFGLAIEALKRESSTDAISREEALKALNDYCKPNCEYSEKQRDVMCGACKMGDAIEIIENLPTVTPERPNVNDVLDKIRAEIEQLHHHPKLDFINTDKVVDMAIEIIDKHRAEQGV